MATYSTLRKGARGDNVTNLQQMLNKNGYNLAEDGVFGGKTLAAVRDYQSKNGLTVDGIVGNNTWGKLTGNTSTTPSTPKDISQMNTAERLAYYETAKPTYDSTYSDALKAHLEGGIPKNDISKLPYNEQIAALTEQIANRQPFNYDYSTDPLYRQYAQQYARNAKMAMQDTMANAAALTGGYGSSSAQAVGNQAYNQQMEGLNDRLIDLRNAAYESWLNEGNEQRSNLDMYRSLNDEAYNRNRDNINDWYNQADLYRGLDSDAYGRSRDQQSDYFNWLNYYYGKNQDELAMALAAAGGRGGRGGGGGGGGSGDAYADAKSEINEASKGWSGKTEEEVTSAISKILNKKKYKDLNADQMVNLQYIGQGYGRQVSTSPQSVIDEKLAQKKSQKK